MRDGDADGAEQKARAGLRDAQAEWRIHQHMLEVEMKRLIVASKGVEAETARLTVAKESYDAAFAAVVSRWEKLCLTTERWQATARLLRTPDPEKPGERR